MADQFDFFDPINPGDIVPFHNQALDTLIRTGNADAALFYLCLARNGSSENLPWDFNRVEAARKSLVRMGLIPDDPTQNTKTKSGAVIEQIHQEGVGPNKRLYTVNDVASALDNNEEFRNLVPAVEQRLERILSRDDLVILYATYDSTGLTADIILKVTDYCIAQRRRGRPYSTATITQICSKAEELAQGHINLPSDTDVPLPQEPSISREVEILSLLFCGKIRRPTEWESIYLKSWIDMGFSDDLLQMAYDRTIFQLQKFSWPYMNGILTNWNASGLSTADDVENYEKKHRETFRPASSRTSIGPSPSTGASPVTAEDVDRMFEYIG